jgi:hypothetical protein
MKMTKTRKLGAFAAMICFAAIISCPRSSHAQDVYGVWQGTVSYQVEEFANGQFAGYYSGSYQGELSLDYYDAPQILAMSLSGTFGYGLYGYLTDPFGPDSAAGTLVSPNGGYYGPPIGDFAVTYQSIPPGGMIDVGNGLATADITATTGDPYGDGEIYVGSFVSAAAVPEPSSIFQAATALLIVAAVLAMTVVRPRWGRSRDH